MEPANPTLLSVLASHDARARAAGDADETPETTGRVLVVEEHTLMAEGLRLALSGLGYVVETSCGPTAHEVVEHGRRFRPGCVLTDIRFRNAIGSGITLIEPFVEIGAQVVMLTAERRRSVLAECLEAGAAGWIERSAGLDDVDAVLRDVFAGEPVVGKTIRAAMLDHLRLERATRANERGVFDQLTGREALVLAALTDGLTAEEIARAHFVALSTVRSQIRAVLQKLDVRSQVAAVALASARRDLLPQRDSDVRDRRRPTWTDRDRERFDDGLGAAAGVA